MSGGETALLPGVEAVRLLTLNAMGKPLPQAVLCQLQHLWLCAVTLAVGSEGSEGCSALATSHNLSLQFVNLASQHSALLPAAVKEHLCSKCSVIMLPSITCSVRVRPRSQQSGVNRRAGKKGHTSKVKNQVVFHCRLCQNATAKPGSARQALKMISPAIKSSPAPGANSSATVASDAAVAVAPPPPPPPRAPSGKPGAASSASKGKPPTKAAAASLGARPPAQKSFSFKALQSMGGGGGGGGLGSISSFSNSYVSSSGSSATRSLGGIGGLDFVPLGSPNGGEGTKRVSLVELERQQKKQRKGGGGGTASMGMGLGSIQQLLTHKK